MNTRTIVTGLCAMTVILTLVGCEKKTIHQAIRNGKYNQVKKMLDDNPELLQAREQASRWSPLHYAADRNQARIVDLLLARGADPLAKDPAGWTPLDAAMKRGNLKVEKKLRKALDDAGRPQP